MRRGAFACMALMAAALPALAGRGEEAARIPEFNACGAAARACVADGKGFASCVEEAARCGPAPGSGCCPAICGNLYRRHVAAGLGEREAFDATYGPTGACELKAPASSLLPPPPGTPRPQDTETRPDDGGLPPLKAADLAFSIALGGSLARARELGAPAARAGDPVGLLVMQMVLRQGTPSADAPGDAASFGRRAAAAAAAKEGDARARFVRGVQSKGEERARWLLAAARQGYAPAQAMLGQCYLNGWGVPKSGIDAFVWFRRAAEQGEPSSQFFVGGFYMSGIGAPRDGGEANYWYRKAARQGYSDAEDALAEDLASGAGIYRDAAEADFWLRRAAADGSETARQALRKKGAR